MLQAIASRAKKTPASRFPRTIVTMNSRVRLVDGDGAEREVTLVYPWEGTRDRVAVTSDLGLALLGASVGDSVAEGRRTLRITSIPYQPEAEGAHHL